jgi:hypothetical protein
MPISRRKFVKVSTIMGLSTVISLKSAGTVFGQQKGDEQRGLFALPQETGQETGVALTEAAFSQHLNSNFRIYLGALTPVNLQLIEVTHREQSSKSKLPAEIKQEGFSILFAAPAKVILQQGMYKVEHEQMGTFDLFIVPMRKKKKGQYYEAVFNRLVPKDAVTQ